MKWACLVWMLSLVCVSPAQSVRPSVAKFISGFSFASSRVDLKPDDKGNYPHLKELGSALIELSKTDDGTLETALRLLDKNESSERLVACDLLLILMFEIPSKLDWGKPENIELRNILSPLTTGNPAEPGPTSPNWPWVEDRLGHWRLTPFRAAPGTWDKSLVRRYQAFKDRFKRR